MPSFQQSWTMSSAPTGSIPQSFEIKSAELALVSLLLKSVQIDVLAQDLQHRFGDSPDFFDQDPLLIDFSAVSAEAESLDFKALLQLLKQHKLVPVAFKGANEKQAKAALKAGLARADDALNPPPAPRLASEPAAAPVAMPVAENLPALVVDKPLRSGQQVYARGRDLVVMAMVNPGAEVIADGHIHVYAPLRGKAIAGARGFADARIFAQSMEAQLISIAGVYRTSETPLPDNVLAQPAQVRLQSGPDGDKLILEPLN
jgi:septum site-determining protein MinC